MSALSLLTAETPIILQGITGRQAASQVQRLLRSGTRLVAGVAPGHAGESIEGIPIFNSVADATNKRDDIQATMILVPPAAAPSAVKEAVDAGLKVIVLVTEHIAAQTTLDLVDDAKSRGSYLIGPNTAGLILPGRMKIGIMAHEMYRHGRIALLSRSGTLMSEVAHQLSRKSIGQSVCIDIGGDQIVGIQFTEVLEWLEDDAATDAVVVLGEIGGPQEDQVASYLKSRRYPKRVYGLVVGHSAPPGRRMGHAGALVEAVAATALAKTQILADAGAFVATSVDGLVRLICEDQIAAEPLLEPNDDLRTV